MSEVFSTKADKIHSIKNKLESIHSLANELKGITDKNDIATKSVLDNLSISSSLLVDNVKNITSIDGVPFNIESYVPSNQEFNGSSETVEMIMDTYNNLNKSIEDLSITISESNALRNQEINELKAEIASIKGNGTSREINESDIVEQENLSENIIDSKVNNQALVNYINMADQVVDIEYNGNAKIINVFGYGSYGVTTTALSLAYKLYPSSKVLFIDFDLSSPNADEFMNIMPVCKGIPGYSNNGLESTALGILFEEGADFIDRYKDSLIKHKEISREGCLDYMSGLYYRASDFKILTFDYSKLFNTLGNIYDYIIIDIGKISMNAIKDIILKKLIGIPNTSNVAVTQCNKFKIRNLINNLTELNIDTHTVTFILNMCDSTALSTTSKNILNDLTYYLISDEPRIRQTKANFNSISNKIVRSQFSITLQSIV